MFSSWWRWRNRYFQLQMEFSSTPPGDIPKFQLLNSAEFTAVFHFIWQRLRPSLLTLIIFNSETVTCSATANASHETILYLKYESRLIVGYLTAEMWSCEMLMSMEKCRVRSATSRAERKFRLFRYCYCKLFFIILTHSTVHILRNNHTSKTWNKKKSIKTENGSKSAQKKTTKERERTKEKSISFSSWERKTFIVEWKYVIFRSCLRVLKIAKMNLSTCCNSNFN